MADPHVITALVKRRAVLAGQIEATHEALRKMILGLENLDATIVQFDPSYHVEAIRPKAFRPPKDWSNRGEMTRIILSILIQAAEPLTTRDIALQLLVERALDRNDLRLLSLMTKRVGVALRGQARRLPDTAVEHVLKCLGAAVIMQWNKFPTDTCGRSSRIRSCPVSSSSSSRLPAFSTTIRMTHEHQLQWTRKELIR